MTFMSGSGATAWLKVRAGASQRSQATPPSPPPSEALALPEAAACVFATVAAEASVFSLLQPLVAARATPQQTRNPTVRSFNRFIQFASEARETRLSVFLGGVGGAAALPPPPPWVNFLPERRPPGSSATPAPCSPAFS